MNKKIIIGVLVAVIIILIGTFAVFMGMTSNTTSNVGATKTTIELYNDEKKSVDSIINTIEDPNYRDKDKLNNETVNWLKSLDDSYVVLEVINGLDGYVVMKRDEANKIPPDNDTSIMTVIVIKGFVKETHNLGAGLSDYTLIENVEFVNRRAL